MILDATRYYHQPLTEERLFAWQASLFPTGRSGMTKFRTGAWRDDSTGPMQVVSGPLGKKRVHYEAPQADRVAGEMCGFIEWFEAPSGMDPVLKAALAHQWFVTIHPFDDGNGRIARAIADLSLARSENSRQRRVLHRLLDGFEGKLTTSKYAVLAKCSQDTALRDIEPLVEHGVLIRNPEGGRSTSYSLPSPATE